VVLEKLFFLIIFSVNYNVGLLFQWLNIVLIVEMTFLLVVEINNLSLYQLKVICILWFSCSMPYFLHLL